MQPLLPLGPLLPVRDGDPDARALYNRHYSARRYRDGRRPKKFIGPGEYLALMTPARDALITFRLSRRPIAGQTGIYLTCFRNESPHHASRLLRQAVTIAFQRWPQQQRIFTFINPRRVRSTVPGYCFRRAGFRHTANTAAGLLIFTINRPAASSSNSPCHR